MNANTRYKASVFSLLFGNAETVRELYGAITGVQIPPDEPITINTLEDVLFMEQINDFPTALSIHASGLRAGRTQFCGHPRPLGVRPQNHAPHGFVFLGWRQNRRPHRTPEHD
jgi:hypothetical protein